MQGVTLTKGNVDDRKPVSDLTKKLTGLLFGDKGYINKVSIFKTNLMEI